MENKSTIFFGSSDFSLIILEKIASEIKICAVVTSPPAPVGRKQIITESPVALWAKEHKVPILAPQSLKNNSQLLTELKSLDCNFAILASYGKIIPKEIINLFLKGIINVHPSFLPKYRGASPIQSALLQGENETGVSLMLMDEQLDHGPILSQKKYSIPPSATSERLSDDLAQLSAEMLLEIIPKYLEGKVQATSQNEELATFTKLIKKEDGMVFWDKTNIEIYNQWRAFQPWPGIWTKLNGKIFKILDCDLSDNDQPLSVGEISPEGLVGCGSGVIKLLTVQLEGSKPMSFINFSNGHEISPKQKLG